MQAGGRRFDPVWLHQVGWCETGIEKSKLRRAQFPPLATSGGCLDIVKKGYARDVESRQSSTLAPAHRDRSQRRLSSLSAVLCVPGALGSLTASLGSGLSRCNWSFYRRCSPCREGAGRISRLQSASAVRLSQVGIANESDQVSEGHSGGCLGGKRR